MLYTREKAICAGNLNTMWKSVVKINWKMERARSDEMVIVGGKSERGMRESA